jgi:hypothetical protein
MTKFFGIEKRCPHCGGVMHIVRFGVPLTGLKARILDLIKSHPGITTREINAAVFNGRASANTIRTHVHQLNDALCATNVAIRGSSGDGYRLIKIEMPE